VLLCDETGRLIDGDDIMAIAALDMLKEQSLAGKTLVTTVMSNAGLAAAITAAGGNLVRTAVGDKHVIDEMLRHGYNFGGEQSGHLIFRDYASTGDGLVSALQILRIMKAKGQPLSQLAKCWTRFPQLTVNVKVREKTPFAQLDGVNCAGGRGGKGTGRAGRPAAAALLRHGTESAPARGGPRRRDAEKMVG
jgi:phosphoglucosamine mutase